MPFDWQQVPRAQTSGHVYEITDTLEYTSAVPEGATPQDAVDSYKAFAADQTTQRRCLFLDCVDGNPTTGMHHFWMPAGTFEEGGDG